MATKKKKECEHDFLAIVHCKKCGEQYHTNWMEALVEVKLEAVENVLRRIETTIRMKSKLGEDREEALELVRKAFNEVKRVFEEETKEKKTPN